MNRCMRNICLFVVLGLLFFGCRDSVIHAGHPSGNGVDGGVPVSIVLGEGSGPSRTIAPEHLDQAALGGYTLALTGSSDMGDSVNVPNFTLNNGVGMCDLSPGVWKLELVASNGGTQVLRGEGTVEVRGLPTYVSITLTPVTSGTGTVRLTVNWQAADRDFVQPSATPYPSGLTVSMALYDPVTGQKATSYERRADGSDGTASDTDAFFRRGFTGTGSGGSTSLLSTTFTYTGGTSGGKTYNVPAGMYRLRFMITGGNLPAGTALQWSDLLYVEAGRETTGIIDIPQMAIKPAAPTNPTITRRNRANGILPVELRWGAVYNAEYYELEVVEHYTATVPTNDNDWDTLAATNTVSHYDGAPGSPDNYLGLSQSRGNQRYISGGLGSSATSITLGLGDVGKKYAARIRSANAFGVSPWAYYTVNLGSATMPAPAAPTNFTFTCGYYESATSDFPVFFEWTDNATNEAGYELEVMEFHSGLTPRTDTAWNAAATAGARVTSLRTGFSQTVSAGILTYTKGSLRKDATSLAIRITRTAGTDYYAVRLRAWNEGGESSWVYPPTGGNPAVLLMPVTYIARHTSTRAYTVSGKPVYDATLYIHDVPGSTCTYEYEFIYLKSGSLDTIFSQSSETAMNTEWNRLFSLAANNTAAGRSGRQRKETATPTITQLNGNVYFPFRVRTVILNNNTVVEATKWTYYTTSVIQAP